MSDEYPYEVRDPQRSTEWTAVANTWNAWASVRAFLKLKGYKAREFVDAPRIFEVRHPRTDPAAIHEVRVSVPLRIEMHVRHHGFDKWAHVGRTTAAHEETMAALEEARGRIAELEAQLELAQRRAPLVEGIARSELGRE
jgi:hypothetical protein